MQVHGLPLGMDSSQQVFECYLSPYLSVLDDRQAFVSLMSLMVSPLLGEQPAEVTGGVVSCLALHQGPGSQPPAPHPDSSIYQACAGQLKCAKYLCYLVKTCLFTIVTYIPYYSSCS